MTYEYGTRKITGDKWLSVSGELKNLLRTLIGSAQNYGKPSQWLTEQYMAVLDRYKLPRYARAELSGYFEAYKLCKIKTQFAYKINGKLYGTIRADNNRGKESFFPHYETVISSRDLCMNKDIVSGFYYESGATFHE